MRCWNLVVHLSLFTLIYSPGFLAQEMFPAGNFEKLRRGNCTTCHGRSHINGAQLPRLTLIKQKILQALGRGRETEPQDKHILPTILPKAFIAQKATTTTSAPSKWDTNEDQETSSINEIVTFSETIGGDSGKTIIKFKNHNHHKAGDVEAVGASLLLYINRRRKIRKGGRGKKIMLTVTDYDEQSNSDEILTYLRTRVKRRRWKKLSLPLTVAQRFLDSGERGLSLKVTCLGCGRLVQLVFYSQTEDYKAKKRKRKGHANIDSAKSQKKSRKRARGRQNMSTRPILVISTRSRRKS